MDSQMLVLLLAVAVGFAGASLRPTTPDELHRLLVWAQNVAEGKDARLPRLHDKNIPLEQETPPTPTPSPRREVPRRQYPVVSQPLLEEPIQLPANEEYDRDHRYSHSILHGFRFGL